jgi:hypothetical protein
MTKEEKSAYDKEYYRKNKDRKKALSRKRYLKKKDLILEHNKGYYEENKDKIASYQKEYRVKNKKILTEKSRIAKKERREKDPMYKMACQLKSRTRQAFKKSMWQKNGGTEQLLGTTYEEAFRHLTDLFTEGMSWDNYGEWHIDHKKPLASAKTEEELKKLCHYTNLQPLWAIDNLKKGAKI